MSVRTFTLPDKIIEHHDKKHDVLAHQYLPEANHNKDFFHPSN
jgi:hypothetical protein